MTYPDIILTKDIPVQYGGICDLVKGAQHRAQFIQISFEDDHDEPIPSWWISVGVTGYMGEVVTLKPEEFIFVESPKRHIPVGVCGLVERWAGRGSHVLPVCVRERCKYNRNFRDDEAGHETVIHDPEESREAVFMKSSCHISHDKFRLKSFLKNEAGMNSGGK